MSILPLVFLLALAPAHPTAGADGAHHLSDIIPVQTTDPIIIEHEASGLRVTLPAGHRFAQGRYDDGAFGGRVVQVFPRRDEMPEDWNAVSLRAPMATVYIFALPADELPDAGALDEVHERVSGFFGASSATVDVRDDATFAGRPALQVDIRSSGGGMVTLTRHVMTFHNGMRYGAMYFLIEDANLDAEMQALVRHIGEVASIELPE